MNSEGGVWLDKPSFIALYDNLWKFSNQPVNTVLFLLLLVLGAIFYFVRRSKMKLETQYKVVLIWFLIPFLLMFALSFKLPMFLDRYLVFLSVGYYLLIAIAIDRIGSKEWMKWALGAMVCIMMFVTTNFKAGITRKNKAAIEYVIEQKTEKTIVIVCPGWHHLLFSYYYDIEIFKDFKHTQKRLAEDNIYGIKLLSKELKLKLSTAEKVIYFDAWDEQVDPNQENEKYLDANFTLIEEILNYEGTRLRIYVAK
jgi:hypothetical protein